MWKPEHRIAAERSGLRYPSDLTDAEWAMVAPMIPPAKSGGRRRTVNLREVLNGICYVLWTGCQWPAMPKDLPPKSTVWEYFNLWTCDGTLERIHHALYVAVREQASRQASPTTAIIDSQSAKAAQKGGPRSIRKASMQARRSRAASDTFSSTRNRRSPQSPRLQGFAETMDCRAHDRMAQPLSPPHARFRALR
jgi:transposase